MYDVYVIANRDTPEVRERFAPLSNHVRVEFIFDRSAVWPEHFPKVVRELGTPPTTDYYYVIRGEQHFLNDIYSWLQYDIEKRSVVVWPVLVDDDFVVPRSGLCLFPSDMEKPYDEEWVQEDWPESGMAGYPTVRVPNSAFSLESVRSLAAQIDAPYFHLVPDNIAYEKPHRKVLTVIDPEQRTNTMPIYRDIMTVPESMRGHGYPERFRSGTFLLPAAIADTIFPMENVLYGAGWEHSDHGNAYRVMNDARPPYDIFMLTNGETNADANWELLRACYPRAQRLDRVKGVLQAHVQAAALAQSDYFWVIDGDNQILPEVDFDSVRIAPFDPPMLFVYRAMNNVNGLCYGNGGIKLFPTEVVRRLDYVKSYDDFTSLVADRVDGMRAIDLCWSRTVIDSTQFEAWRAGFREGAKLTALVRRLRGKADLSDTWERLKTWALHPTEGNGRYTTWGTYAGFIAAREFTVNELRERINDYDWLEKEFVSGAGAWNEWPWTEKLNDWQEALRNESAYR